MRSKTVCLLLFVGFALFLVVPASTQVARRGATRLSKHDHELLAAARVQDKSTVMLLVAASPRYALSVARGIESLGGTVRMRDDDLDYVRAIVPISQVERVAGLNGIEAVNLDELVQLDDPSPMPSDDPALVDPPGPATPTVNPYMPTRDIGAPQFIAQNPTFDGRGVKIAIVDTGVDILTPELQTAKSLNGAPVRKIVDWVNMNDPLSGLDPSWIDMQTQVTVSRGSFSFRGTTYTGVPSDGAYRFGIFSEASISPDSTASSSNGEYAIKVGGKWCADLNRNGICHESFGVLWRASDDRVWVDSDADRSFADESAMRTYKESFDIGLFGTDNPLTPIRESVPFVVQTDGKDQFVNIGVVGGAHATHVAGIAAGKGFFGGVFNGAAPEAQIVSVRVCMFGSSCTASGMIDGMIYAAKTANVDVINMSIGGLPALNDGNNVRAVLYNRLIDQTKAQMFISAGNDGPGVNTVGDPSVATKVMSVGAYVAKDTWYSNYGVVADRDDGLFTFSSRGPAENGGFKPDIVAPGCAISSLPAWQPGQPVSGTYPLPPGYGLFNGTSMAAPEATGGAALLLSAARQWGAQFKPDQLRAAIHSSARFLPAYGAHEQGNGLFQVGLAWDLLRTNIQTAEISSFAPVETILSDFLAIPHTGPGIYEREGWKVGDVRVLPVTFVRTKGSAKPVWYNLSWVGNDGTFSFPEPAKVALPRDVPVTLNVTVAPATSGVHSAILNLDDLTGAGIEYQVMNTVVAAEHLTVEHQYIAQRDGTTFRPDKTSFFYYVPPGVPMLKVDLTVPTGGIAYMMLIHPWGSPYSGAGYFAGPRTRSLVTSNPTPGVWEVTVESYPYGGASPLSFSITASILGVSVAPSLWVVDPAQVGNTYEQSFSCVNKYAPYTGFAAGTVLGGAIASRPDISMGEQQIFDITVPAGSTQIYARIGNPSDAMADLDLYLYDCTSGPCTLRSSSLSATSNETVSYNNPKPGHWKVLVDTYNIPSGSTAFDYMDVFAHPAFGGVSSSPTQVPRAFGESWLEPASVKPLLMPPSGRFLFGYLYVVGGGYVIGSAEVNLRNVYQ